MKLTINLPQPVEHYQVMLFDMTVNASVATVGAISLGAVASCALSALGLVKTGAVVGTLTASVTAVAIGSCAAGGVFVGILSISCLCVYGVVNRLQPVTIEVVHSPGLVQHSE